VTWALPRTGPPSGGSILVFSATYNEAATIGRLIGEVAVLLPEADHLIVDDSSPDGTGEIVAGLAAADPRIRLVRRPRKSGLSSAHALAQRIAHRDGYARLVTMDADLSHDPGEIPALLAGLDGADFVIGTRSRGGALEYRGLRRVLSRAANGLARLLLPTGLSEYTNGFRAFSAAAIAALHDRHLSDAGYAYALEQIEVLHRAGLTLTEVPTVFRDRAGGQSKIPRTQVLITTWVLLRLTLGRLAWHLRTGAGTQRLSLAATPRTATRPASSRATGTRNGEHET